MVRLSPPRASRGDVRSDPLRIVIVDDHPIVRKGLTEVISQEAGMAVCGQSDSVAGGLEQIRAHRPDVAIVDLSLGVDSGLQLVKEVDATCPGVRVLVLSMHDEMLHAERALAAGARGYIMKHEAMQNLIAAVRCVADGRTYVSPAVSESILARLSGRHTAADGRPAFEQLSDREREVFTLIGKGLGTREIAHKLGLSVKTIETHQARIKEKLGLASGHALTRAAITWLQL